jgi:hypothetical protein
MDKIRNDADPPPAISEWGWKYHHLGVPTMNSMPGEIYLQKYKFYVSGFNTSPFGIEWMRFEEESPVDKLIQTVPHLAFEVGNIDSELMKHDFKIISEPGSPSQGVRSAMIEFNGAPVELIEFDPKIKSQGYL